jgi:hypothetical protein
MINLNTKFGVIVDKHVNHVKDSDWINSDEIRQEWLNRGAILV